MSLTIEDLLRQMDSQLASSLILIATLGVVWTFISMVLLRRTPLAATDRRRWRSAGRGILILSLLFGLIYIWAPELRTFALSIVAFAVAIVIATKELILCFTGGIYRLATGASKIGDRVSIGDARGEIIDQTLLAITLQEMGRDETSETFTGQRIVVPNSVLLATPIINESTNSGICLRELVIPLQPGTDVGAAQETLLAVAKNVLDPLSAKIHTFWKHLNELVEATAPGLEPQVNVRVLDHDKISLVLHFFVPAKEWPYIRNKILAQYLASRKPQPAALTATEPPTAT